MSWFSALFNADKAADNILDKDRGLLAKAGAWVGKLNFTEEELRSFSLEYLKAMAPFNVMQRIMVTIIMVEWFILSNVMVVAMCLKAEWLVKALYDFVQTEFIWVPIAGAVSLYLLGGVWPSRKVK